MAIRFARAAAAPNEAAVDGGPAAKHRPRALRSRVPGDLIHKFSEKPINERLQVELNQS
jgi:hypothetical protein